MQAVADLTDDVSAYPRVRRERKINAVPRATDDIARDQMAGGIPEVNAIAAAVLCLRRAAKFATRRIARFKPGNDRIGNDLVGGAVAENHVAENLAIVGLPHVDAVQHVENPVAADDRPRARDMNRSFVFKKI